MATYNTKIKYAKSTNEGRRDGEREEREERREEERKEIERTILTNAMCLSGQCCEFIDCN